MAQAVTSILSVTIGDWSGQALGDQNGSANVQDPTKARVEFVVSRTTGTWALTIRNLATIALPIKVDAAFRPLGDLTGPIRLVHSTGETLQSRLITKDGGVITGQRIDPISPDAFVRDRFTVLVPAGAVIVATGEVDPCDPEDLNGDGAVGATDLAIILGEWGSAHRAADINRDGIVGPDDLASLLAQWSPK